MKEIKETFEIKFSGEDNKVYIIAHNDRKHNISTGRYSANLTTEDIRDLGKHLLDIAAKLDNDPDFNKIEPCEK